MQAVQLLACDWLLSTRTGLWQIMYCSDDMTRRAPLDLLSSFEQDLNSLRRIARVVRQAMAQVNNFLACLILLRFSEYHSMLQI